MEKWTLPGLEGIGSTTLEAGTGISSKPLLISAHTSLQLKENTLKIKRAVHSNFELECVFKLNINLQIKGSFLSRKQRLQLVAWFKEDKYDDLSNNISASSHIEELPSLSLFLHPGPDHDLFLYKMQVSVS